MRIEPGVVMELRRQWNVWVDHSHAVFRRGMVACLSSDDFVIRGQSALFDPTPQLEDVDLLVFEAVTSSLRHAVRLTAETSTALVATTHAVGEPEICRLLDAGVSAVLPHADLTCEALISSIRAVLSGVAVVPAATMPRVLQYARASAIHIVGGLTDREREVLRLLAEGSDTQEIATGLCFSERTVKNVVHDILMKLNCRTRAHAVALATRSGVI
jgi:DNA-binding NarL/FixJ family response regulator